MTDGTAPTRVFFVHVMKTGGTSVLRGATRGVGQERVWGPVFDGGSIDTLFLRLDRYTSVRQIWALGDWQLRETRLFMGHFPWCATELVDPTVVTATVLRDPVERTLSYLRHCQQRHEAHSVMALEEIYEDPWHFPRFVRDHQTKVMSLTLEECLHRPEPVPPSPERGAMLRGMLAGAMPPGSFAFEAVDPPFCRPVPMDRARLDRALANLEAVEVLGLQEDHDAWALRLARRAGWPEPEWTRHNVSAPTEGVSAAFRRRIAEDNALDVELYARARDLVAQAGRA